MLIITTGRSLNLFSTFESMFHCLLHGSSNLHYADGNFCCLIMDAPVKYVTFIHNIIKQVFQND